MNEESFEKKIAFLQKKKMSLWVPASLLMAFCCMSINSKAVVDMAAKWKPEIVEGTSLIITNPERMERYIHMLTHAHSGRDVYGVVHMSTDREEREQLSLFCFDSHDLVASLTSSQSKKYVVQALDDVRNWLDHHNDEDQHLQFRVVCRYARSSFL